MGIVIDTNVLEHADNPDEMRQLHCIELIEYISATENIILHVDEGFDTDEARNRSRIGSEYWERLPQGSIGHTFLLLLFSTDRIDFLSKVVPSGISNKIRQKVHDISDVVFAKVTYNSDDKVLISHDFKHFPPKSREFLLEQIGIEVMVAADYHN